jgi:large subunit ribosomal protein L6
MSRIGRLPVALAPNVKASFQQGFVQVEGPKGKLEVKVPKELQVAIDSSRIVVRRRGDTKRERELHGLTRKLIANVVEGVGRGFTRALEITGVGYRAEVKGKAIHLSLGYSHPIVYQLPPSVSVRIDRQTQITLEGPDRQMLGTVAAQLRSLRPPEPYKGKGVKYAGELIRRKAGKAAAGTTA